MRQCDRAQVGASSAHALTMHLAARTRPRDAFSAPWRTCRPNRPRGGRSTHGRIFFRSASCSTRWPPGNARSPGDTSLSILSSILKDTPRPVTDINPALPRDLGRIIRRALAKDPERRYQSAKDLRNDLEDLKALLDSGELTSVPTAGRTAVVRHRSRKLAVAAARAVSRRGSSRGSHPESRRHTGGAAAALHGPVARGFPSHAIDHEWQCGTAGHLTRRAIRCLRAARWRQLQPLDSPDDDHQQRANRASTAGGDAARRDLHARWHLVDFVRQAIGAPEKFGGCRSSAGHPGCSSPMWPAPSRGRQMGIASPFFAPGSRRRSRRN